MQHAVDADARDSGTRDAREQGAAQGVAEGVAEAGLERLNDEPRAGVGDDLFAQSGALCNQHCFIPSHGRPLFDAS